MQERLKDVVSVSVGGEGVPVKERVQVQVNDSERGGVALGLPVGVPDAVGVAVGGLAVRDGLRGEALGGGVAEPVCEVVRVDDAVARRVWEGVGEAVRGVADAVALLPLGLQEGLTLGLRDSEGMADCDGDGLPEGLGLTEGDEAVGEGSGPDSLWDGVGLRGDGVPVQERDAEATRVNVMVWESVAGVGVSEGVGDGDVEAVGSVAVGGRVAVRVALAVRVLDGVRVVTGEGRRDTVGEGGLGEGVRLAVRVWLAVGVASGVRDGVGDDRKVPEGEGDPEELHVHVARAVGVAEALGGLGVWEGLKEADMDPGDGVRVAELEALGLGRAWGVLLSEPVAVAVAEGLPEAVTVVREGDAALRVMTLVGVRVRRADHVSVWESEAGEGVGVGEWVCETVSVGERDRVGARVSVGDAETDAVGVGLRDGVVALTETVRVLCVRLAVTVVVVVPERA